MRKLVRMAAFFAATTVLLAGCGGDDKTDEGGTTPPPAVNAPTIVLQNADIDKPQEIADGMSVKVDVAAPGGVKDFAIQIESPCLTEQVLGGMGLSATMNLVTPASDAMAEALTKLGFPVKDQAKDAKTLSFDLSTFIPLIAQIYDKTSDHKFRLTVTDGANQKVTKTLWFHLTGLTSVEYNDDADLWANTASLTIRVGENTQNVKLEYRRQGATDWQKAEMGISTDGTFEASIAPVWAEAGTHVSGIKLYTPEETKGVFAGHTYEYRVLVDDKEVEGAGDSFTVPAGPGIPGGNMETWSETIAEGFTGDVTLYAPTAADGSAFWSNGCNAFTPTLCVPEVLADNNKVAKLQGGGLGTIFAAGNLFTGVFEMAGMAGYARFGEVYEFKARPRAIRLRYKALISTITMLNPTKDFPNPEGAVIGAIDPARIFVCITDWSNRHSVYSGLGVTADKINPFDPEKTLTTEEGEVLAFASKTITESVNDWTELTLELKWKDQTAKPQVGTVEAPRYSLVISAAASAFGDYLCGCKENELYLDAFEWVY